MIKTVGLKKVYRTKTVETAALDGVSLEIGKGELVAIMGPSGCGKSTLLNVLGLIENPTEGQYFFLDKDVSGWPERRRAELRKANIGFVFQSFNLIDDLTVFKNVELPLSFLRLPAAERHRRVEEILERMGIAHRKDALPHQLSGGQQQRVAIARAMVIRPQLLLADEPTGNLDSVRGAEVLELLRQLNADGTAVVMVTHSPTDAESARRVIRLRDGKVVSEGMTADLQEVGR
ncbi:MAG TPA: ABC transporter ATP-binding protein [Thermoanaerobaculia bacterium]|nr:ABC transporter ATP-binding protein [Thermoanaerobaculia bacterium]